MQIRAASSSERFADSGSVSVESGAGLVGNSGLGFRIQGCQGLHVDLRKIGSLLQNSAHDFAVQGCKSTLCSNYYSESSFGSAIPRRLVWRDASKQKLQEARRAALIIN